MALKEQHKVSNLNVSIITKKGGIAQVWIKKIDETTKNLDINVTLYYYYCFYEGKLSLLTNL